MNTWIALILRTDGAKADMLAYLDAEIAAENDLTKATDVDKLNYQRGLVDGFRRIRFVLDNPPIR